MDKELVHEQKFFLYPDIHIHFSVWRDAEGNFSASGRQVDAEGRGNEQWQPKADS